MVTAFGFVLLTLLVVTAIAIVVTPNLFVAVMLMSIFSLLMAATFFLLDAADVALTEAAIGAGMSTILFLGALALIAEREAKARTRQSWLALAVIALTAFTLIFATFDKPRLGDPAAPVHQHVAPWYLEQTPVLMEMSNVVTAVLASFRAYDTLAEVLVILTAGLGVMLILSNGRPDLSRQRRAPGLRHHLIPRVVGQLLIPFIVLFGLYLQFHGEYGPGGGFQAGAIIAVGIVLHALLEGEAAGRAMLPTSVLVGLITGGALLFCAVGFAGILLGGNFLDYSLFSANPVAGQQLGIHLIEAGVGITVAATLVAAFHTFADREPAA